MARKKRKKEKIYSPVFSMMIILIIVSLLSMIFSIFEIEAYKTVIANNTLETTLVTVKNIISLDGLKFIIENIVDNFRNFEPLILIIISLFGIGICERSGLLYAMFSPFKKFKFNLIIFLTLLISIISTVIGDYSYIFLIPLVGVNYKYMEKNPILGILITFVGISIGYGTGFIFNYNDHLLGLLTQTSASLDIDVNYKFSLLSNIYIMISSTIIISYFGTLIIDKFLVPKFTKKYVVEEEELIISKKAMKYTFITFIILVVIILYGILPVKLRGAGLLLDTSQTRYIEKLFSNSSPFG
ncbi:MAG: AbgT family transporter, partial [Bacilli bacterium]|nr:AbgT family transporter [Bacilli bacterium]